MSKKILIPFCCICLIFSCKQKTLPIIGERFEKDGQTIYESIPDFSLVNQDSLIITQQTVEGKIYIADFFFTSCPTICPKVMREVMRVFETYKHEPNFLVLCHSIDYKRDSVGRLKHYAQKLGITDNRFHFLTGDKAHMQKLVLSYKSTVIEDDTAPGGFNHSGYILLVDKQRRIRSFCKGTDTKDVDRFIEDIATLLNEKN